MVGTSQERSKMLNQALDKSFGMVTFTIVRKKAGFAGIYPKYFLFGQVGGQADKFDEAAYMVTGEFIIFNNFFIRSSF